MIYLFHTNLQPNKTVNKALEKIHGIGRKQSQQICNQLGISNQIRINQLSNNQLEKLTNLVNTNYQIGSDLARVRKNNITRLVRIASYRGFRHTEGLPVRGQRTHGNSKTCRKFKKPILSLKTKQTKKVKKTR